MGLVIRRLCVEFILSRETITVRVLFGLNPVLRSLTLRRIAKITDASANLTTKLKGVLR